MPFDSEISYNEDLLWEDLATYAMERYLGNDAALSSINAWFHDLLARRNSGEDLRLDFVHVNNQVTGHEYKGFRLNEALIMSHDQAVLLSPYPQHLNIPTNRNIGFWFHDLSNGYSANTESEEVLSELDLLKQHSVILPSQRFQYASSLVSQIKAALSPHLPDGDVEQLLGGGVVRYAKLKPEPGAWHNDTTVDPKPEEDSWNYIIAHPFLRNGTVFALPTLGGNEKRVAVRCPTHVTSGHLALRINQDKALPSLLGAEHFALRHKLGRGLVIFPEYDNKRRWEPMRNKPSP